MKEPLSAKQARFTVMVGKLIAYADKKGYRLTWGDAYRDPRLHGYVGTKKGYGRRDSCHKIRLAVDFNLFKKDEHGRWRYLRSTKAHKELGEYWESLSEDAAWGGHFGDGNHYSISHQGRR